MGKTIFSGIVYYRMKQFLALFLLVIGSCSEQGDRIRPTVATITESVYASATVKASGQHQVYSTVVGILKDITVKPGDSVNAGDALFILDNRIAALNTRSAGLALEQSRNNIQRTSDRLQEQELNVKVARDKYQLDSALYRRQQKLWEQNIGTRVQYEQQRLSFNTSRNNYRSAQRRLSELKTQLKNELDNATVGYDIRREQQSDYTIKSTISGRVFDVLPKEGDLITLQTPMAVIGHTSYLLEMNVDERDISRIRPGMQVEISMDSYPDKVFQGRVEKIYPIMNERTSTFKVDARFLDTPPRLYPNLKAEANIVIQTKSNALIIPREYLDREGYVWISKDEKRQVKTGLRDYRKVEILHGIDSNQYLIKPVQ